MTLRSRMQMHFAPNLKRAIAKDPMCGYVSPQDEICTDASLCTCPECLDWIRPDHDTQASEGGKQC